MAKNSKIEWTDTSWNPVTGCNKVSAGCKHCYAERQAKWLQKMKKQVNYRGGFALTMQPHMLSRPLKLKTPHKIFVNSMSDLFHEQVSLGYIQEVFEIMRQAHWHTFQILTKRAERLAQLNNKLSWLTNVWMGVSVENSQYLARIDHLRETDAKVKFLSLEPLLGPLPNLNLAGIDWVIVGGESGPKARPVKAEWITDIRDQCLDARVPFFFKQWGGKNKAKAGRVLDGRVWDQSPTPLFSKP